MIDNSFKNLDDCHTKLDTMFDFEDLRKIDTMSSEYDMDNISCSCGRYLRNTFGLWGNNELTSYLRKLGFTHADDMSQVILYSYWHKRHGLICDLNVYVELFKKHWESMK